MKKVPKKSGLIKCSLFSLPKKGINFINDGNPSNETNEAGG
ncbi:hypothetical protein KR50_11090 [Jeotgalibacillus campisalis]|uniref:Uncharacterized protein n=1 Tax=Jeotgalibacillus campisalis TaxID=220754 RepID=A0A0C2S4Y8_9BACL|nr:hypothetical protein KR50_11090 [Jeotgalibacillus campisalis]